ncbi:MAG: efflux RND transporter periplasmic adaptor subunit, partial [Ignavibacteria bacterium]|nr:efflux RND transporter periplasmic adaptor subunit [Ignavibacteria bacterium]
MKQIQLTIMALAAMFLISCGSSNTADDPSKQLETYRKQQSEIDAKIEAIQKQINDSDQGATSRNRVAVRLQELKATTFSHFFEVSGTVIAVQEAFISPEINGQIKEIFVKEGDRVKKGQVLAKLTTEVTDKSIEEVKTSLVLAEDIYQRQQRLWDQKIGSEMQYLQAKNNKISLENRLATLQAQIDLATVNAPISGIVEKVNQKKGEMAAPGMQLIYVVNLDQILIRAEVSEKYITAVKKGENVDVRFPSYPDFSKAFPVSRIGNVVNK